MASSRQPKYKIFVLPSHTTKERTSGVDMVRIIQPMQKLGEHPDFQVDIFDPFEKKPATWMEIAKKYDAIYFNYINNDWGYAAMACFAKNMGCKLVMDLDDALWEIQPDNFAYKTYKKGGKASIIFTIIAEDVDYMTTTNQYLKNMICQNAKKETNQVQIFKNYIDFKLYSHRSKFKDTGEITLMHFGSTSHFIDLEEEAFGKGVDRIMKEYPNVKLKTIGAFLPKYKERWGSRYENGFGDVDVYKWIKNRYPEVMDETDIMVVPLKKSIYTKAKSSIKFIESGAAKKPGVWQDIRQYQEVIDGNNGFLAQTQDEWYEGIKTLIDDKVLRKKMGENAFKTVKKSWQIDNHMERYVDFFKKIIDKKK